MKAKAITEEVGVMVVRVVEDGVMAAHGVVEDGVEVEDGVTEAHGVAAAGEVVMVDHGVVAVAGAVAGQKNTLMLNLKIKQEPEPRASS
ncbi:hypothetical protein A2U01_0047632, partial [Trifolium medium]|nr:hypothetical protein [Trifolium medium]